MNPVTGEKILRIEGRPYILKFTWAALSEIEQRYGDKPNLFDPAVVADVAAAGLRERHPEMTAEAIMKISPPLAPFATEVQQALQWAYFGPGKIPESDKKDVKKNRRMDGLWKHIRRLFRRGSLP